MGKQGKGRRLTDKERMEIITLTRENPRIKHVELAAKYNVNESTIRKWRAQANAAKIEERYSQGVAASRDGRQRGQAVRNSQFDAELYEWVAGMMKLEQDLAPARVREKARSLASQFDGMDGFKASSGWYYRFCRRYGLPCGPAGRDAGAKMPEEIQLISMIPMDGQSSKAAAAIGALVNPTVADAEMPHGQQENDAEMTASSDAAAIAISLQPPSTSSTATARKDSAPPLESDPPQAEPGAGDLLLGLGDMAAVSSASAAVSVGAAMAAVSSTATDLAAISSQATSGSATTVSSAVAAPIPSTNPVAVDAPSVVTALPAAVGLPPGFSMSQAAVTHMVQHFKDVLDPQTRLRLVRHLTRVSGEAEMYLVMDDETRLEYVKEFSGTPATANTTDTTDTTAII